MIDRLRDDIRHGARILTKSPGLSATAALLIALVVGGNATIYSMVNSVIHQPAPGVTATDLVSFGLVGRPGAPYFKYADYAEYAVQTRSLRSVAAWGFSRAAVAMPNGTYQLQATPVTHNYFDTLGISVARGRAFTAEEDTTGAPLAVVIADGTWEKYFQRADDVIGRRIDINGRAATIIGVTPPRFAGPSSGEWSDLWIPLHAFDRVDPDSDVAMIGRLARGSSIERARAEFQTLQARVESSSPRTDRAPVLVTAYAASAGGVVPAFERQILAIFSIVTLLTLLVVCANVANLMLARAVVRQRETAVRQSLGASRGRLVRLLVVEGLAIAAVACVLSFVVAYWVSLFIPSILPQGRATMPMDFRPDWRVAVYAAILTLIGTMLFSLVPALRTWRQDPLPLLKDGAHTTARGRSRVSSALVVLQLAFSVLLLTAAGLAYRSGALMSVDVGFDPKNMLLVRVGTSAAAQSNADNAVLLDRIRERLTAMPNVASVSYTGVAWNRREVRTLETTVPVPATVNTIGADYLETLGLAPLAGRGISRSDRLSAGGVAALINARLAVALFPGRNALGQTLLLGREQRAVEVVGIVPNAYYAGFNPERPDQQPNYVLLANEPAESGPVGRVSREFEMTTVFHLRYRTGLDAVVAAVPAALRGIDPRVALATQETLEARLEERALSARMISMLLGSFAGISLLIAAVGQYAVIAFDMRRRTRDFGVRMAIGASARQIVGSVMREGAGLTLAGLAAGFALSVAIATLLRGVLFGVTPTDARTYAGVFALLAAVSLFACYLPARRASRIDPVQALRQD